MAILSALAQAIARFEGYFVSGSRAARNNNPGNLRDLSGRLYPGYPRDSGGFIVFPTAAAGWHALEKDLSIKASRGWSISQIISAWAPASDNNDTAGYIRYVSARVGLPADVPVLAAGGAAGGSWAPAAPSWFASDEALIAAAGVSVVALGWLLFA